MGGKREECEEHSSAWEIALADLMTVLMVFFLVMWLTSIVDPEKRKAFVESVLGESGGKDSVLQQDSPKEPKPELEAQSKPEASVEDVTQAMSKVNPKDIDIEETPEGIKLTLRSDSFFESGRATIKDDTLEQLEKLGESLAGREQQIVVTGYTDNVPISNFQFPSNWELSAARAATVARTFIYMGVGKNFLTIEGKADNDPVAPNATPYGRSLNRRVVILVKNKQAQNTQSRPPVRSAPAR